jgi:hypothetical protein
MRSLLQTSASLLLKVKYDNGQSKVVGFARGFSVQVNNGQAVKFVVDSPFPAEIAQGTAPSQVRGSLELFLPKNTSMESVGLVPYRTDVNGDNVALASRYLSFEIYDRLTNSLIFSCDYCKVGNYSISSQAKGVTLVSMQFDGILMSPGQVF